MKIFIASDHAGFELKQKLIERLQARNLEVVDEGPADTQAVDYPDYADKVCRQVFNECVGILICGSGQGMAMRANKYPHIRAALCWSVETARLAREHNDANVLCLSAALVDADLNLLILESFLASSFEGGRHARRVVKLGARVQ